MSGQPIRLGLIGCGAIARDVHLPALASLGEFDVIAVAEGDARARMQALELAPAARAFVDYRDLLTHAEIDAVVVALPNQLHSEAALAALSYRRHVYLEKPIGIHTEEVDRLQQAAARDDRVIMVGFNYRYHPLTRQLRALMHGNAVGRIVAARSIFTTPGRTLPPWKQARRTGGGVLLDLASHHFDLARFVFAQPIVRVAADIQSLRSEHDVAAVSMTLANGVVLQSLFSFGVAARDEWTVYGDRGVLHMDRHSSFGVSVDPLEVQSRPRAAFRHIGQALRGPMLRHRLRSPGRDPSFGTALRDFAAAIRGQSNADRPILADGRRSLGVVLAAEFSAETGRPVEFTEPAADAALGRAS